MKILSFVAIKMVKLDFFLMINVKELKKPIQVKQLLWGVLKRSLSLVSSFTLLKTMKKLAM